MGQTHCGIRGIDALAAVSGSPHHVDTDILLLNHDIDVIIHLGHHRHTDR